MGEAERLWEKRAEELLPALRMRYMWIRLQIPARWHGRHGGCRLPQQGNARADASEEGTTGCGEGK
jgi:hypothetical protein